MRNQPMNARTHRNGLAAVAGALLTALPALAGAQNILSVPNTMATAGAASVAVPIDLSGPDLTTLAFNVNFDPSFCAALVDPTTIKVTPSTAMACTSDCSNGGTPCTSSASCLACTTGGCQARTKAAPLEQPITCSSGTARIALDTGRGDVVIGKGQGEILDIDVGPLKPGASGSFVFTPASIDAHNGPLTITIVGMAGTLTITSPTTTSSTSSSTSSSTTSTTTSTSTSTTSSSNTSTTSSSSTTTSIPAEGAPDCTEAFAVPDMLWPPNHRFMAVTIAGVTDPSGGAVTITVTAIMQNEPPNGSGPTCPDAKGLGTDTPMLRAERDGEASGRVYHVSFRAENGGGGQYEGTVIVCVPINQSQPACVDQDTPFDSTCSVGCGDKCLFRLSPKDVSCPGELVPHAVQQRLVAAHRALRHALRERRCHVCRTRLVGRAMQLLAAAERLTAAAQSAGRISPSCALQFANVISDTGNSAQRWLQDIQRR